MDIRCKHCGEPWEIDSLHVIATEQGITFDKARKRFYSLGCGAFEIGTEPCGYEPIDDRTYLYGALQDLLGDDIDGVAAMIEDLDYMGF